MDRSVTRRQFLKSVGAAGATVVAAGLPGAARADGAATVPRRAFGRTGVKVSSLALGTMFDTINNQVVLRQALQLGVTYWDTADCYEGGNSEVGIGKFFQAHPEERDRVFLATKSDENDPESLSKLLARSLERMHTDHVDLYLLHGVSDAGEVDRVSIRRWVEKAKAEKKIGHFGFSTHKNVEPLLRFAAKQDWLDGVLFVHNYRTLDDAGLHDAIEACHAKGLGLAGMKFRGRGPDTGDAGQFALGAFAAKGYSEDQAKLKALLADTRLATVAATMGSVAKLQDYAAAAMDRTKLGAADREALRRAARADAGGYCAGCAEHCEPAAGGAPVADVLRFLMYARAYGEPDRARRAYRALGPAAHARLDAADLSAAQRRCPRGLPVARLVAEARAELA